MKACELRQQLSLQKEANSDLEHLSQSVQTQVNEHLEANVLAEEQR